MPPKKTLQQVREYFKSQGYELLSDNYINQNSKLRCKCSCGNILEKSLNQLRDSRKCFKCGSDHRKHAFEDVKETFEKHGCTLLEDIYYNISTPMKYLCECGSESTIRYNHFLRGVRCKRCGVKKNSGENHVNYKPEITDEERYRNRLDWNVKKWAKEVKERDSYRCQICRRICSGNLISHHVKNYAEDRQLRYDLENGITMCEDCHTEFHQHYGYRKNNKDQVMLYAIRKWEEVG